MRHILSILDEAIAPSTWTPETATAGDLRKAIRDVIENPPPVVVTPWVVSPAFYESMLADPEWEAYARAHLVATRPIPRDRRVLHHNVPAPAAPPRLVLIDSVIRAALAAEGKRGRSFITTAPRTNPSTHFTLHRDGTIEDHTPYLRGHSNVPPNDHRQQVARIFDVPEHLLSSEVTYANAADDRAERLEHAVGEARKAIGTLGGVTVVADPAITGKGIAAPASFVHLGEPVAAHDTATLTARYRDEVAEEFDRNLVAILVEAAPVPGSVGHHRAQAEHLLAAERRRADEARQEAETVEFVRQLDAVGHDNPGLRVVLDLHAPDNAWTWPSCNGCDWGSYAEDPPEWPCSTIDAIAEHHGITEPAHIRLPKVTTQ